jgi:hypothetical protein
MKLPRHIKFVSNRALKLPNKAGASSQTVVPTGVTITATKESNGQVSFTARDKNNKKVAVKRFKLASASPIASAEDDQICLVCVPDPEEGVLICQQVACSQPPKKGGGGRGKPKIPIEKPIHKYN